MSRLAPAHGHFEDLGAVHPIGLGARAIRAYVPHDHATAPRPLVILFDGQNIFGDAGSFAGGWHACAAVDQLARARRAPAPIVVGIEHGGLARIAELTPFSDGRRGGQLDALVGTIVDELLPRVHARFSLAAGPAAHVIGGASLGGLAALYAHLRRPDVFGVAIGMSPSLWFTHGQLAAFVEAQPVPARSLIYLDAGVREGGGRTLPIVEGFAARFRARGWGTPAERGARRMMMRPDARGRHDERSWRRRFPRALRFALAT
ncbi:MAG: alpha/beta hydrolase-fold protein [Proteobacteria bacterium]|nr:alpha/beta hydrolase-fold protein [Pseudomonadota bacterium]